MSIYFLDTNPELAAQAHGDKHLGMQILITAKILSAVHRSQIHATYGYTPVGVSHVHIKKAKDSPVFWRWLQAHGMALCKEWTHRFSRSGFYSHESEHIIRDARRHEQEASDEAQLHEHIFWSEGDVEHARNFYMTEKTHLLKFSNRAVPGWMADAGFGEQLC